MPWHCNGFTMAMQEEKEKKRKKNENNFVFFLTKKTKLGFGMSLNGLKSFQEKWDEMDLDNDLELDA